MIQADRRKLDVVEIDRAGAGPCGNDKLILPRGGLRLSRMAPDARKDPWKEAVLPSSPRQSPSPEVARILEVADNNG